MRRPDARRTPGVRAGMLAMALAVAGCTTFLEPDVDEGVPAAAGTTPSVAALPGTSGSAWPALPRDLLDLDGTALVEALGEPGFVWVESEAELWRYDAGACTLFVYLYPDGVRHADLHGPGLDDTGRQHCFCELVAGCT